MAVPCNVPPPPNFLNPCRLLLCVCVGGSLFLSYSPLKLTRKMPDVDASARFSFYIGEKI